MAASATTEQTRETREKDPNLPALARLGDIVVPRAPQTIATCGLAEAELLSQVMRLAYTVPRLTTEWVSKNVHLSTALAVEVLGKLAAEGLLEQLWQTTENNAHYKISDQGREHAKRLNEICGYMGPAPVGLEAYSAMLRWQFSHMAQVQPENVQNALTGMVLNEKAAELAGLGASSGRSLFVHGPPGNGKSTLGRLIRDCLPGDYWIPYAISAGETVIRMFDAQMHQRAEFPADRSDAIDQRWVRIRRPLIIVGGELTIEMLDLIFIPSVGFYEAPPHLKSNGGVFLVDDFGRERVSPDQLLNRFITPMEHQVDYFTLRTGQKLQIPLKHVLIIATNISLEKVTDPAFLRRMGYRIYLGPPTQEEYVRIFNQYAQRCGVTPGPEIIENILERYRQQKRELRACEPRDLIERARDICRFHSKKLELTTQVLDLAWTGYFGALGEQ
jgi:hypothetical protein